MSDKQGLSPDWVRTFLETDYELAAPLHFDWLSSGLNDLFWVNAGTRRYVLKIYRAGWRTHADVLEELGVLGHLDTRGVRVALPIPGRDGALARTVIVQGRERVAALFTHSGGREIFPPDERGCHLVGRALADVHNATDDFTAAPVRYEIDDLLSNPLETIAPVLADRNDIKWLLGFAHRIQSALDRHVAGLDHGYCHGDFRLANVHRNDISGEAVMFDFEFGGLGFRLYDLANLYVNLHPLAAARLWECPPAARWQSCWNAFLRGYTLRRPLSAHGIKAIPLFAALRVIHLMGFLVSTARQPGNEDYWIPAESGGVPGGELFDRALPFLREWERVSLNEHG